jgi:hypothetical protein
MGGTITRAVCGIQLLLVLVAGVAFSQTSKPVQITFDEKAGRVDLKTGKVIPDFTLAERGSIQFFLGRLDHPDAFFNFYHDGFQTAKIEDVMSMEKIQEHFAIWRIYFKSGGKNTPRVQHQAISFIPIGTDGKKGERVYVLLKDLRRIDWSE